MDKSILIDEEYLFDAGVIVSSMDSNGNVIYANRKFLEMTSYSKDELYGNHHSMLWHPDMPAAILDDAWTNLNAGNNWEGAVKYIRKDGRYYWVYLEFVRVIENGITLYSAARRPLDDNEKRKTINAYNDLLEEENNGGH
jgi:aerotaxis receptor